MAARLPKMALLSVLWLCACAGTCAAGPGVTQCGGEGSEGPIGEDPNARCIGGGGRLDEQGACFSDGRRYEPRTVGGAPISERAF